MPLLIQYCYNTCLQDITVNTFVSTPPIHIGQDRYSVFPTLSQRRYQIEMTGLDDTQRSTHSATINSSVVITIYFSSLINTFLNLLLIICDLPRKVAQVMSRSVSWAVHYIKCKRGKFIHVKLQKRGSPSAYRQTKGYEFSGRNLVGWNCCCIYVAEIFFSKMRNLILCV